MRRGTELNIVWSKLPNLIKMYSESMSVPLSYYRFILLAEMPSHLTVIKIYDSDWAWLSWRAASEPLWGEVGTALASWGATKADSSSRCCAITV